MKRITIILALAIMSTSNFTRAETESNGSTVFDFSASPVEPFFVESKNSISIQGSFSGGLGFLVKANFQWEHAEGLRTSVLSIDIDSFGKNPNPMSYMCTIKYQEFHDHELVFEDSRYDGHLYLEKLSFDDANNSYIIQGSFEFTFTDTSDNHAGIRSFSNGRFLKDTTPDPPAHNPETTSNYSDSHYTEYSESGCMGCTDYYHEDPYYDDPYYDDQGCEGDHADYEWYDDEPYDDDEWYDDDSYFEGDTYSAEDNACSHIRLDRKRPSNRRPHKAFLAINRLLPLILAVFLLLLRRVRA